VNVNDHPTAVIGAGPIGLAAAAHLRLRKVNAIVLEAGPAAGAAVRDWSHVRLFSPWSELIDQAAAEVLDDAGWVRPDPSQYPTGGEWVAEYLEPLAEALGNVRYNAHVIGVAKRGRDLLVDSGRDSESFAVHVVTDAGEEVVEASAVIDASGTWTVPNPLGGDGLPAIGEPTARNRISYRIPDLTDSATRARFAGKHIVVAGTGASAKTVLVSMAKLAENEPGTRISWLVRRSGTGDAFGGGDDDQLRRRGELGKNAQAVVRGGAVQTLTGFRTQRILTTADGTLTVESDDGQQLDGVDEIVAVTGFRPDLSMLSEVRLDLDSVLQAPTALAPQIDPNVHSCGTVAPHGAKLLAHPEVGFYLVGMKSYGRATSFLALTGFEQVRSVVAEIAGDHDAAARVELTLPETGVCGGAGLFDESGSDGGCCAPAAPQLLEIGGRTGR
jgi:thioredoxin reductase